MADLYVCSHGQTYPCTECNRSEVRRMLQMRKEVDPEAPDAIVFHEQPSKLLGSEIFQRLQNIQDIELQASLDTTRKLRNGESVSDGNLLDALYALSIRLDVASPLLPVCHETLKRLMMYAGITETPRGIKREWLDRND